MNSLEDEGKKAIPAGEISALGGVRHNAVRDGGETGTAGHTTGIAV